MRGVSHTKPGPRIADPLRYPCGDPRTPENTVTRLVRGCPSKTCRACENAYQRNRKAAKRRSTDRSARQRVDLRRLFVPERHVPMRRWVSPSVLSVIEASRAEYEAAIASKRPGVPDSTDPAQLSADFGGEG